MATDKRLTTTESILCESLAEGIRLEDLLEAFRSHDREREGEGPSRESEPSDDS